MIATFICVLATPSAKDLRQVVDDAVARSVQTGKVEIDLKGETYEINTPILVKGIKNPILKNGTIIDKTRKQTMHHAALGFLDCSSLVIRDITFRDTTNTGIGIANSPNAQFSRVKMMGSKPGAGRLLQVTHSNNLLIEDSTFSANQIELEVVSVSNGHPWYRKGAEHYFYGGLNLAAFIGDKGPRAVWSTGKRTLNISFDPSVVKDTTADYKKNHWMVYWPGMPAGTNAVCDSIDLKAGLATLSLDSSTQRFPDNQLVSWFTYNPDELTSGVRIRRNSFSGSKSRSGLTLYWVKGFQITDNTAHSNRDYGIGVEWCQDGVIEGNKSFNNQSGWNQYELVFMSQDILVRDNEGIAGIVSWGNPVIGVQMVLKPGSEQDKTYNKEWRTHQHKATSWPSDRARLIAWFENVRIGEKRYQPPYYYVPERLVKLNFARSD